MAFPRPPKHIVVALTTGILMVVIAWISKPERTPDTTALTSNQIDAVQVARPASRPYIDITDSDSNGIPDWQDALQKTEPLALPTEDTAYEEPDTLTEQFALEFFEQYMRGERYGEFGTSPEELVSQSGEVLARQAQDEPITRSQITTHSDTDTSALATYGEQVAIIINRYSRTDTEPELEIMDRAIRLNDETELEKLDPIITVYENILADTLLLAVPDTYSTDHLILLNAYQAILNDLKAMRISFNDPMLALLRVQRYQEDATGLNNAIAGLYNKLLSAGVTWDTNSAVWQLIEIR